MGSSKGGKERGDVRPHQGAVYETSTFCSFPSTSLTDSPANSCAFFGGAHFFLGLTPVLSVTNSDSASRSLLPPYSCGSSLTPSKNLTVGNPWMPKRLPSSLSASASTFAICTPVPSNARPRSS